MQVCDCVTDARVAGEFVGVELSIAVTRWTENGGCVYVYVHVRLCTCGGYVGEERTAKKTRGTASTAKRVGCENTIAYHVCTAHMHAVNALNITLQIMRIYSTLAPCFSLSHFLSLFISLPLSSSPSLVSFASLILPNYKNYIWPYYCKVNLYNELRFENVTCSSWHMKILIRHVKNSQARKLARYRLVVRLRNI